MTDDPETTRSQEGRDEAGRWLPGASGNPAGRPKGARHRTTVAIEKLLQDEAEALTREAINTALGGDVTALRLCLERLAPPRKDGPVTVELPPMETAADASRAMAAVVCQVAEGELTPAEGAAVAGLVETFRRTLETTDLEARIGILEDQQEKRRGKP